MSKSQWSLIQINIYQSVQLYCESLIINTFGAICTQNKERYKRLSLIFLVVYSPKYDTNIKHFLWLRKKTQALLLYLVLVECTKMSFM